MKGLVIDDSPIELMMEIDLLKKVGFIDVWGAETCAEGFNIIQLHKPDIVLCDVDMPDYSGIELLKQCEDYLPNTNFIMCSVMGDPEWIVQAIRAGAVDYILKPVKESKVRLILQSLDTCPHELSDYWHHYYHDVLHLESEKDILNYQHGICVGLKIALRSMFMHRFGFDEAEQLMNTLSNIEDIELLKKIQDALEMNFSQTEFKKSLEKLIKNT